MTTPEKQHRKHKPGEKGSVFTVLLAGIAMVGVLSVAGYNLLTGPVATTAKVTLKSLAEQQMQTSTQVIMKNASAALGDCDGDGYVEPALARVVGTSYKLPLTLGVQVTDPWGTDYKYCPFDPYTGVATSIDNSLCGSTTGLYNGYPNPVTTSVGSLTNPLFAIVSAGPDRQFQTACRDYASGSPTNKLVYSTASSNDDLVYVKNYSEAFSAKGDLWSVKGSGPRTNWVRNSTMVGAVAGTPGTLPTGWAMIYNPAGYSYQVVGTGTEDGMTYVDIRFYGNTSTGEVQLQTNSTYIIEASPGQTWTSSMYVRKVAGTTTNISGIYDRITWYQSTGIYISHTWINMGSYVTASSFYRGVHTSTATSTNTGRIGQVVNVLASAVGTDITLRIAGVQLEQGSSATAFIPTSGSAVTSSSGDSTTAVMTGQTSGIEMGAAAIDSITGIGSFSAVSTNNIDSDGGIQLGDSGAVATCSTAGLMRYNKDVGSSGSPTYATPALVRSTTVSGGNGATLAQSFSVLPAAGNSIIVAVTASNWNSVPSLTAASITDNQSGTYVLASSKTEYVGSNYSSTYIFYRTSIAAPSGTFTVTANNPSLYQLTMQAMEVSGLAAAPAVDARGTTGTTSASTTTSNTVTVTAPGTLGQANNFVVSAVTTDTTSMTITYGTSSSGWTVNSTLQNTATAAPFALGYKVTSATTAPTIAWNIGNILAADMQVASMATFKASSSGGTAGSGPGLEFCNGTSWKTLAGSGGGPATEYWTDGTTHLYFTTGNVMLNTSVNRAGYSFRTAQDGTGTDYGKFGIINNAGTSSTSAPYFAFNRARGTQASPAAIAAGDYLGGFKYFMRYGGSLLNLADLRGYVSGTASPTGGGTLITQAQAMTKKSDGGGGSGTPAIVRSTTAGGSSSTTVSQSFASLPAAGNTIIIVASTYNDPSQPSILAANVTDNQGGTYTQAAGIVETIDSYYSGTYIFYRSSISAPSGTFTININNPSGYRVSYQAFEVSGIVASSPIDANGVKTGSKNSSGTSTTLTLTGPGTLSQASNFIISGATTDTSGTSVTYGASAGWTVPTTLQHPPSKATLGIGHTITSATTTPSLTWTIGGITSGDNVAGAMATFKASAGGGSGVDTSSSSFSTAPTAGNAVIVTIACYKSTNCSIPASGAVTDNQGNTYTQIRESAAAGGARSYIYAAYNVNSSGTYTITVNPTGTGDYLEWGALEVSGMRASSQLDVTGTATANSTGVTVSATTGYANDFVVAVDAAKIASSNIAYTYDSAGGWAQQYINNDASSTVGFHVVTKTVTSAGSASHAWTHSSGQTAAVLAAFRMDESTIGSAGTGIVMRASDDGGNLTDPVILDHQGYLGIGTLTPSYKLHTVMNGRLSPSGYQMQAQTQSNTANSELILRRSRGSEASPSALSSGDAIGSIDISAYSGSQWLNTAEISAVTTGAATSTTLPSKLSFYTGTGNVAASNLVMQIGSDGDIGINNTAPYQKLHLSGTMEITDDGTPDTFTALPMPAGGHFLFYPNNAALLMGYRDHTWTLSASSLPTGSIQWGRDTRVDAANGIALGYGSVVSSANSNRAIAMGYHAVVRAPSASGTGAIAMGARATVINASRGIAIGGEDNIASGLYGIALGGANNTASGQGAIAMGRAMTVSGANSVGINLYGTVASPPAISVVQTSPLSSGTGTSGTSTFASTPTAGNAVIVTIVSCATTSPYEKVPFQAGSVTDNKGNNYFLVAHSEATGDSACRSSIFYANNIVVSAGFTITATAQASSNYYFRAIEVSGLAKSAIVDAFGTYNNYYVGTTSITPTTSASTTQSNTLGVAVAFTGGLTSTLESGWTSIMGTPGVYSTYKVLSTAGIIGHTFTFSGITSTSSGSSAAIAVFKGATAGSGGSSTPAVVQTATLASGSSSTASKTFTTTPTLGNTVIVTAGNYSTSMDCNANTSVTVSDNKGNTYSLATAAIGSHGGSGYVHSTGIWYAPITSTSATFTVTATSSTCTTVYISLMEVSGLATSSQLDKTAKSDSNFSTSTTATTAATTQASEIAIGVMTDDAGDTVTAPSGWTVANTHYHANTAYKILSATGTVTATWTTPTSQYKCSAVATFKAAGGATVPNDGTAATLAQANTFAVMNGKVGIGTVTPGYNLEVVGATGLTGSTVWTNTSDRRLKDIDGAYTKGLAEIVQLQPVTFNYKKNNPLHRPSDIEQAGFIAQDVQKIFPEAVHMRDDGYLDLSMHSINVAKVNAIKELAHRADTLADAGDNGYDDSDQLADDIRATYKSTHRQVLMRSGKIPQWGIALPALALIAAGGIWYTRRRKGASA